MSEGTRAGGGRVLWLAAGLAAAAVYVVAVLHLASVVHRDDAEIKRLQARAAEAREAAAEAPALAALEAEMARAKLVIGAIHLAVFAGLTYALLWPPLRTHLDEEAAKVCRRLQEAEKAYADAEAAYAAFRAREGRFEEDAEAIRREERERGEREAAAIVASAERAAATVEAGCDDCITRAAREARNGLKAALAWHVRDAARDCLARALDEAAREGAHEAGLGDLEALP